MRLVAFFRSWYWLALLGWAIAQGLAGRAGLPPDADFWDAVFTTQSDPYVFFYAVHPVWLIVIALSFPTGGGEIWLIREGSRARRFARWSGRLAREALIVAGALVAAGFATAFGLPLGPTWSAALGPARTLAAAGIPPAIAIIGQVALLTVALTVAAVSFILRERWSSPTGTVVILAAVFALLLIGGNGASPIPLSAGFLAYMHGSLASLVITIVTLAATLPALWLLVRATERHVSGLSRSTRERLLVLVALTAIMLTHAVALASAPFTLADLLRRAFAGGTPDSVHPLGFATYALIVGAGALWVGARAVQHDRDRLPLLAVRHGRIDAWARRVLRRILGESTLLIAGLLAASTVVTVLLGGSVFSPDLGLLLGVVGVIGLLQAAFLSMVSTVTIVLSSDPRLVAGVFAVTVVLAAPPLNPAHLLPVGLSLTGDLVPGRSLRDVAVLLIAIAVAVAVALLTTRSPSVQRRILGRIT